MEISQYIIVSPGAKSYKPKIKLVSSLKGQMPANAIAIRLNFNLPNSIFEKPKLEATIKINPDDLSKPTINAEVLDNIKAELNQKLGIEMTINVVEQKNKK